MRNIIKSCCLDWVLHEYSPPTWATIIGGVFVVVSLILSVYLLFEHLSAYKHPEEQKFLIGVILMVPCYAVESFISLLNPSISVDVEILRDGYESFAMYCFGRYLVACLGGEQRTIEFMEREGRAGSKVPLLEHDHGHERGIVKHHFPFNYFLKPWKLNQWVYQVIKFGIVQYMLIKAFTAILAVILEAFGAYCEGEFRWNCGYPYMAVILNFSQSWALYCLVQFYTITKVELAHIQPLAKFLTFKSIVFLTWWQGLIIALLYDLGLLRSPIAQALQFQSSVQDFIICIEMGIASFVHLYVFPAKPYELMEERFPGSVSVLGDYVGDFPVDPDEIRDSERPTKLRLPHPEVAVRGGMTPIKESVKDIFVGGGGYIVNDVKFTVSQAVEPMEKGFSHLNRKFHKISQNIKRHDKERKSKDDSCVASPSRRVIRGIDDPLLNGSMSDSASTRKKKHRRKSGYTSAESGGESSDHSLGGYQIRGRRMRGATDSCIGAVHDIVFAMVKLQYNMEVGYDFAFAR
ncbi:OLC1v1025165C1 [Oldenlandia corymbosa var. corymbosa]|uniref:OLC1v1025165C1 n=1 Tax=Oldenlandia corymbosa var. corymbosa TaxID=529605 RepID=A0AAV1C6F9_OLDCO|nr:OLC1v1025165C1 [Oldenlandia corymbosa var. corymbosa]